MAVRTFQLGIVFTVGFYLASATPHAVASEGLQEIPLSLHIEDPKDVIVARGQSASFSCKIRADTGMVDVRWHYNGMPIPSDDSRWRLLNDGTLFIPKVAGKRVNSSEGEYQCLVRNDYGTLLSNPAKLKIATFGRDFIAQPGNVSVSKGEPVVMSCNIHSFPSAKVTWERNLLPLPHTTRYVPLPSGALLITSTHSSDVGSYRCKVTNQILNKTKYSQVGHLSILADPTVVIPPKFLPLDLGPNVTALVGENLTLYCAVSGWPLPAIQWLKNMSVITNSSLLELQNVTADDSGDYVCTSFNSGGRISQTFNVQIQQIPYFNVTPVSSSYPSPRTLRLQCEADGIPKPKVYWLINGTSFELDGRRNIPQSGHGLVISHSFTTDTGLYQCIAENSVGRRWVAAQLVPNYSRTRPSPPINVKCRPYNDTGICLSWSPPPKIDITAYSVYAYHAGIMGPEFLLTNVTTLLAANLNSSTNYTFYVRLYTNEASDQSQTVTCKTGTNGKRNLHVQMHSESSVELTWSEISSDISCEGLRSPYRVQWRSANLSYINVEQTSDRKYVITDLLPLKYEFRVISSAQKNENSKWVPFALSTQQNGTHHNAVEMYNNETEPTAPYHLEAKALSSDSINLIWTSNNSRNHFFSVCFVEVKPDRVCELGGHLKSTSKQIKITDLKPNTSYEFKVRAHSNDGNYGPYSHALEIRTLPEGPANIRDIKYRMVNSTTVCLKWRAPLYYKNAKYVRYIVSYKANNQNTQADLWKSLNITASQKYKACWLDSQDTLSTLLYHLDSSLTYTVVIKADDDTYVSPATPLILSTKPSLDQSEYSSEEEAIFHKQKLGKIRLNYTIDF